MQEYPELIIRVDDSEEFIHLGEGKYKTKWGHENGSIAEIPLKAFGKDQFRFLSKKQVVEYSKQQALSKVKILNPRKKTQ